MPLPACARPPAHAQRPHQAETTNDPAVHYSVRKEENEDQEQDLEKEINE